MITGMYIIKNYKNKPLTEFKYNIKEVDWDTMNTEYFKERKKTETKSWKDRGVYFIQS